MDHVSISPEQYTLADAIVTAAVQPNKYELIHNVGRVLNIQKGQQVLLLATDPQLSMVLAEAFECEITLFNDDMEALPFDQAQFDCVIVARPISSGLLPVARELARVTKLHGALGVFVLSVHADHIVDVASSDYERTLAALVRPAAAYRAVLAESGFTAFVSTPRKSELSLNARETYRQYMLQPATSAPSDPPAPASALKLLAAEGMALTLITAEKAF